MMLTLAPRVLQVTATLPCYYCNTTATPQILRITNVPHWFFERTLLPGQSITFDAPPQAQLEVHTGSIAGAILEDVIPCQQLTR